MGFYGKVQYYLNSALQKFRFFNSNKTTTPNEFPNSFELNEATAIIGSGNQWIRFSKEGNEVLLYHSIKNNSLGPASQTSTLRSGDSFKLNIIDLDNAGHGTAATEQTYILASGLDFFSEEDIQEIINRVIADFPDAEEVEF